MLIEATKFTQRDYRPVRNTYSLSKIFIHIYKTDVTQVLSGCIPFPGGKIYSDAIFENKGLRGLCEFDTIIRQLMLLRVEDFSQFFPFHKRNQFLSFQFR